MKTKRDIKRVTRGGLPFTIPKGSPVDDKPYDYPTKLPGGPWYYVKPSAFGKDTIERHDATYYGVGVSIHDLEEERPTVEK